MSFRTIYSDLERKVVLVIRYLVGITNVCAVLQLGLFSRRSALYGRMCQVLQRLRRYFCQMDPNMIQTWVLCVWHNAIGYWCCSNLGDAVAGPPDSVSYGGFRLVYGKSAFSGLVLAVFYHA